MPKLSDSPRTSSTWASPWRLAGLLFALTLAFAVNQGCDKTQGAQDPPLPGAGGSEPTGTGSVGTSTGAGGGGADREGTPCSTDNETRTCGHLDHQQGMYLECAVGTQTCVDHVWGPCMIDRFTQANLPPFGFRTDSLQLDAGACVKDPCDPACEQFVDTPSGLDAGTNVGLTIDAGVLLTPGPCQGAGCNHVVCGDGILSIGEQCDDGNTVSGDGCSSTCRIEANYTCPKPGSACTPTPCGDGKVQGVETCDDGNTVSGDGCSSTCQLEPGWKCPTPGAKCIPKACGDGLMVGNEQCDDGNTVSGDGCSATCTLEPGFACTGTSPSKCHATTCGDGVKEGSEQCDDGNRVPYDGCSPTCNVEPKCAGGTCTAVCGDGLKFPSEQCDDGNTTSGDGCSSTCTVEPGFSCTAIDQAPPSQLVIPILYRDMLYASCDGPAATCSTNSDCCSNNCCKAAATACSANSDCCSNSCASYKGAGTACAANAECSSNVCTSHAGDGLTCSVSTDCASGVCTSYLAAGASCTTNAQCTSNTCTSYLAAGATCASNAQCTSNVCTPYKGALATCTTNADCASNSCVSCSKTASACTVATQATDCCSGTCNASTLKCVAGGTVAKLCKGGVATSTCTGGAATKTCTGGAATKTCTGGVTSSTCTGGVVTNVCAGGGATNYCVGTEQGNPDFQNYCCGVQTGLVKPTLGPDSEPVFLAANGYLTNKTTFCWWYHDVSTAQSPDCGPVGTLNPYAKTVYLDSLGNPTTLTLPQQGVGSNIYKYSNTNFYPLDGLGWNGPPWNITQTPNTGDDGKAHNFSFTSELHYPFTYLAAAPAAVFSFDGDDDVWAFINGHLIVDLGGVHSTSAASYTLNAANAATLGLVDRGMYSIDLFQAERHTTGSDYTLTLSGFVHTVSQCSPICGDKLVKGNEVCDDGVNNGAYGGCMPGCSARAPYCGDGIVQNPQEQCDDGVNATTYGGLSATACAPGCKFAPYCGDGIVSNGEQCDQGALNGTGSCNSDCTQAYYYADSFTRDYDASTCPDGMHVVWIDAGLEAKFPTSGGAYGSIHIDAQVGDTLATLGPVVSIGTLTGPPVDQSAVWSIFDLYTPLKAASPADPGKVKLRLTFTLTPTADHLATPDLLDWRARFDCATSE